VSCERRFDQSPPACKHALEMSLRCRSPSPQRAAESLNPSQRQASLAFYYPGLRAPAVHGTWRPWHSEPEHRRLQFYPPCYRRLQTVCPRDSRSRGREPLSTFSCHTLGLRLIARKWSPLQSRQRFVTELIRLKRVRKRLDGLGQSPGERPQ